MNLRDARITRGSHDRTAMLHQEGAYIEPIDASECDSPEQAEHIADRIQGLFRKLKENM